MTQYILIDIDFTFASGTHINKSLVIRPYAADFIKYIANYNDQFDCDIRVAFYTANDNVRVAEVCFCLIDDWGLDPTIVRAIYHRSLHCDNCPMIAYDTGSNRVVMKCLDLAATLLRCKVDNIICLIDDNPDMISWNYQDKRLLCPPFDGDNDDEFFSRLINQHKTTGKWTT